MTKGKFKILIWFRTLILSDSHINNVSSTTTESVFLYIDEHAAHAHGDEDVGGDVGNEIEQEHVTFENINQTVIEVNGATVHHSDDVISKPLYYLIFSQKLQKRHIRTP